MKELVVGVAKLIFVSCFKIVEARKDCLYCCMVNGLLLPLSNKKHKFSHT